jgi:hypothetical protein
MKKECRHMTNTMGSILEAKAQALKDQIGAAIDEYVLHYQQARTEKVLKIDQVEEYLVDVKTQTNRLLNEATTELLCAMEAELTEKKKSALIAEKD